MKIIQAQGPKLTSETNPKSKNRTQKLTVSHHVYIIVFAKELERRTKTKYETEGRELFELPRVEILTFWRTLSPETIK